MPQVAGLIHIFHFRVGQGRDKPGHLWHMRYPLTDGSGYLVVATTRPEIGRAHV